ncbi:MAG TPA: hypothetical protein VMS98_14395 [Thermoanaerobaculia bacterium]|nr:hypothetical protein [Thermoanaerobaculia bacterium]
MTLRRPIFSVLTLAAVFAAVPLFAQRFGEWSDPTSLTSVNTPFFEAAPALSKDERSLYFHSLRPGLGINDIYVSQRATNADWAPAVRIGRPISTKYNEVAPALSRDGHFLFFSTNRRDGTDLDIWVSHRTRVHDDFGWSEPVPVNEINQEGANDAGAAYFENDGGRPQLFFQSNRGDVGATDFYVSEQQDDGTWGAPALVRELSSPAAENRLTIRHDGREVFFGSNRQGSSGQDIWTSTRLSISDPWSTPVNVGPPINTASDDMQPGLSGDGRTLYFTRSAATDPGDILSSTRQPRGRDD